MARRPRTGSLVGCLLWASLAFAEPAVIEPRSKEEALASAEDEFEFLLNAYVTTASKAPAKLDEAPGSVTVITRQQMEDARAVTLRQVLNLFVPSMDVVPTYFRTGDRVGEGIYSRGLLSDVGQQVLVLQNGVKLNDATSSSLLAAVELPLENVERVEVSRTPIPLYGGGAITVVNLITREQSLDGVHASVELAASHAADVLSAGGAHRVSLAVGGALGSWKAAAALQAYDDRGAAAEVPDSAVGFRTRYSNELLRDGTRGALLSSVALRSPADTFTAHVSYRRYAQDALFSALAVSPSLPPYGSASSLWTASAGLRPGAGVELRAGAVFSDRARVIDLAGPRGLRVSDHHLFLEANRPFHFTLLGEHQLLAGARVERDGQHDAATSRFDGEALVEETAQAPANGARHALSGYLEDTWKVHERFTVLAGFALGYYAGFSAARSVAFNPRVSLHFWATPELMLKLLYASAPRPPSLSEQLGGEGQLVNERAENTELAVLFRRDRFKASLTGFYEEFNDRIELSTTPMGAVQAMNTGRTETLGAEAEVWWYFDARNYLFLLGSVLHSRDLALTQRTPFLPSVYVGAGVNLHRGGLNANLSGYFRGPRALPVEISPDGTSAPPHLRLDLSVSYALTSLLRVFVALDNVPGMPNRVPLAAEGYWLPASERTLRLGLELSPE